MVFNFCATFSVAHAARINFNKLFNSGISYTGRTISDTKGKYKPWLIGTYLQTDFVGGSIAVDIAEVWYQLSQCFYWWAAFEKNQSVWQQPHAVVLADNLSKGMHRLRLQKCTEGQYGTTTVCGFYLS